MKNRLFVLIFSLSMGLPHGGTAQTPEPLGNPNLLSEDYGYSQVSGTKMLRVANDQIVAIWQSRHEGDVRFLKERRLAADGTPLTDIRILAPEVRSEIRDAGSGQFLSAADGTYAVLWVEGVEDSESEVGRLSGYYGQWFTQGGQRVGEIFTLLTMRPVFLGVSPVLRDDGSIFLIWVEVTLAERASLHMQSFRPTGEPLGQATLITEDADRRGTGQALSMLQDGRILFSWSQGGKVFIQRFRADGTRQGSPITVGRGIFPQLLARPGGFWILWLDIPVDSRFEPGDYRVQSFSANGLPEGSPIQVNRESPRDMGRGQIWPTPEGGFLVAWDTQTIRENYVIYFQRFNAHGRHIGNELAAHPPERDLVVLETISMGDNGEFLFSWERGTYGGGLTDIFTQHYSIGPCRPSTSAACLRGRRFEVEIDWRDFEGVTGRASPVPVKNDESGLFWFFNDDNWEMLVKVLDGCEVNGHFWVFAATASTVEFTLRVHDLANGTTSEYHNPLGQAAPAIADIRAFPACP